VSYAAQTDGDFGRVWTWEGYLAGGVALVAMVHY
jgi:hypothetical protein